MKGKYMEIKIQYVEIRKRYVVKHNLITEVYLMIVASYMHARAHAYS